MARHFEHSKALNENHKMMFNNYVILFSLLWPLLRQTEVQQAWRHVPPVVCRRREGFKEDGNCVMYIG